MDLGEVRRDEPSPSLRQAVHVPDRACSAATGQCTVMCTHATSSRVWSVGLKHTQWRILKHTQEASRGTQPCCPWMNELRVPFEVPMTPSTPFRSNHSDDGGASSCSCTRTRARQPTTRADRQTHTGALKTRTSRQTNHKRHSESDLLRDSPLHVRRLLPDAHVRLYTSCKSNRRGSSRDRVLCSLAYP